MTSRRDFLIRSGYLGVAALASSHVTYAHPLGKPIGIQLYTVNDAMQIDPAGTLNELRRIGYGEVESAGFGHVSAQAFRTMIDDAGLACPSAHLSFDPKNLDRAFADAHALGATYAISSSLHDLVMGEGVKREMTRDDAKRTAELANRIGEAARTSGLRYAYHNHAGEFADVGDGVVAYDVLLKETDAALVSFEIDCGWMVFAGRDPIDYFRRYPNRFPLIHVKDFEARKGNEREMRGTELGRGVVDYAPIFQAAAVAGLQHYFVEQEGPFSHMSRIDAARTDYDYLHTLRVAHRVT